jgi:hypothetical protein
MAYPLSAVVMATNVCLSRWMTPRVLTSKAGVEKYLNVNLSHEVWRDISFSALKFTDDPYVYVFRLLGFWQGFNSLVFVLLYLASVSVFGQAPVC